MSRKTKTKYVLFLFSFYFLSYFLIQSVIASGHNLLTSLDQLIPFIPEFIWIYHTFLPVIILTIIFTIEKKDLFWSILLACALAIITLISFYIWLPSFYPRHELLVTNSSEWLVHITWLVDGAHNTFPSSHVTFSWLLFYFFSDSKMAAKKQWMKIVFFVWAVLISFSTLFLKQHYIFDVLSGMVLAVICHRFSKFLLFKKYTLTNKESLV